MNAAAKPRPAGRNRAKITYRCENCQSEFYPLYCSARRFCSAKCVAPGMRAANAARLAALPPLTPEELVGLHAQILEGMQTALAEVRRFAERQENE